MRRLVATLVLPIVMVGWLSAGAAFAQAGAAASEIEALRQELARMQERLHRLEQAQRSAPAPMAVQAAPPPAPAPRAGETEISLDRETLLETFGLPKLQIGGTKFSGFLVGSASYNSHVQIVPEFAGGAQALADPQRTNFRFDKFGLGVSRVFAPWLSASAAVEIESHRDKHSHLIGPTTAARLGCPPGGACERFGAETPTTDVTLDKFAVTGIIPIGNGLSLSLARFDLPFGIERHDEVLNLTATTSEVFQFGRPQKGTGFVAGYQFVPWLDASAWVVNRWESETTHDPFDDNNQGKSWGGRLGFTPIARDGLLSFGIGGVIGPERDERNAANRWVIDADVTWAPTRHWLFAGEVVYGGEDDVFTRRVGEPVAMPERTKDRNWWGLYLLTHYDVHDWLGLSFRYGFFRDLDGARTGVEQALHSFTLAPIIHLSRLIPDLKPPGVSYARTRHPINWVDLKLEYRLNHSDRNVFSDQKPNMAFPGGDDTSHQIQLQVVVSF